VSQLNKGGERYTPFSEVLLRANRIFRKLEKRKLIINIKLLIMKKRKEELGEGKVQKIKSG